MGLCRTREPRSRERLSARGRGSEAFFSSSSSQPPRRPPSRMNPPPSRAAPASGSGTDTLPPAPAAAPPAPVVPPAPVDPPAPVGPLDGGPPVVAVVDVAAPVAGEALAGAVDGLFVPRQLAIQFSITETSLTLSFLRTSGAPTVFGMVPSQTLWKRRDFSG